MSHIPERKEKNCLNCGTIVQGRYCHVCGQENVEPKESFWHMVTHFFYDITHFDSSFFVTVKDLVFRPGFLSREYVNGRRKSYLHPVRMYVFTSAMFFLVFFSFFKEDSIKTSFDQPLDPVQRQAAIKRLEKRLEKDTGNVMLKEKISFLKDTSHVIKAKDTIDGGSRNYGFSVGGKRYKSIREYDSIQKSLSKPERDGWFKSRLIKKGIDLNERFSENPDEFSRKMAESVLHRLPYMLFVSLPLFAFLLKLAYIRRKQFYYVDHGIFTIHLYVFSFILLLTVFGLDKLKNLKGFGWLETLIVILFIGLFFYLYKAMRNFYGQRRAKTIFKFLFVASFSLVMMLILFLLFVFFSAATL